MFLDRLPKQSFGCQILNLELASKQRSSILNQLFVPVPVPVTTQYKMRQFNFLITFLKHHRSTTCQHKSDCNYYLNLRSHGKKIVLIRQSESAQKRKEAFLVCCDCFPRVLPSFIWASTIIINIMKNYRWMIKTILYRGFFLSRQQLQPDCNTRTTRTADCRRRINRMDWTG